MGLAKTLAVLALAGAAAGGGGFWLLTAPPGVAVMLPAKSAEAEVLSRTNAAGMPGAAPEGADPAAHGAFLFAAGDCASCHAEPGASGEEKLRLAGGKRFVTEFGTFVAPNISPHPNDGIGGWSLGEFDRAMRKGVSPGGAHYYPAFPYAAFAHLTEGDVADLQAHIATLPPVAGAAPGHELSFPFNIRRGLGLWKRLYAPSTMEASGAPEWVMTDPPSAEARRGRFLVEGPGHCAECHTPRDGFGGLDRSRWLQGAPNPDGPGQVPDISPAGLSWSAEEIAYYLESGFTPDYDSVGGAMVEVVENTAKLSAEDRAAIAAYLKALN